ncbi:hypothetical protein HU200_011850 [Digitaria exilis]|uniref:Reverse transcriptase zinc-binding domain-containing protein n=1 Tax=Digitaria exilis TaxID=1010633 RepID=A0A835FHE5_9POAL|nr:hypothetical protein HU200_011850 [Digitaria exilis]
MRADDHCPFCTGQEDCSHLFITCARAQSFWSSLNLDLASVAEVESVWNANPFSEPNQRLNTTLSLIVFAGIYGSVEMLKFFEVKMKLISKLQPDVATISSCGLTDVKQLPTKQGL